MSGLLVLGSAIRVSAQSVVVFDASTLALQNGDVVSSWGGQAAVGSPTFLTNQTPGGGPALGLAVLLIEWETILSFHHRQ